jgi:pilus assembly protein CpaF
MSLLNRIQKTTQVPTKVDGASVTTPPPPSAEELRRRQAPAPPRDAFNELRAKLLQKIIAELDPKLDLSRPEKVRRIIEDMFNNFYGQEEVVLPRAERLRLFEDILSEILGYGPLEKFLQDSTIDEIMVNGPRAIYIERHGKIEKSAVNFDSDAHVMRIIDRIVSPLGRRVDEGQPYVDARLPDGSRVNVIIPPLALAGPTITIRKFARIPFTVEDMVKNLTFTPEYVQFMKACVEAKMNIVVSGGTGTGKTTQLNLLSGFIPDDERIITIENAAELQLRQEHVISLESRPANIEGRGEVSMRDLVVNSLRMRPDRIIVGECRAGEALDMLQAMNTGHEGSMSTVHANSPRDGLHRLETMVLMAGVELPLKAIREQIASALDVIIQIERMRDGTRRVVQVVEVQGMEGEVIVTQEVFKFEYQGVQNGKIQGKLKPTGIRPKFMEKIEAANIFLPPQIFGLDSRFYQS